MIKTEDILRKNVRDLQEQLQNSYIRNKDLTIKIHKLEKLLDTLLGRSEHVKNTGKDQGNKRDSSEEFKESRQQSG
tara:strand:+ start:385 stop:612 length:228 start_codon:yes stop_codon:yes gene_type:complete